jgi:hypothetical protein
LILRVIILLLLQCQSLKSSKILLGSHIALLTPDLDIVVGVDIQSYAVAHDTHTLHQNQVLASHTPTANVPSHHAGIVLADMGYLHCVGGCDADHVGESRRLSMVVGRGTCWYEAFWYFPFEFCP